MSWNTYTPLRVTPQIAIDGEYPLIVGDGIGKINDDSYTSYHIAEIAPDSSTATLWNYDTETFETVGKDQIRTWLKNGSPIDAALTINEFTVNPETDHKIGLKFHGSAMQSKETIKLVGKDEFSYCLRAKILAGVSGNEITEPYYADETINNDDFQSFKQDVKHNFKTTLLEQLPLDETQVSNLLYGILQTFETNAKHRVGLTGGWSFPESFRHKIKPKQNDRELTQLQRGLPTHTGNKIADGKRLKLHQL